MTLHDFTSVASRVGLQIIFLGALLVNLHARITEEASKDVAASVLSFATADSIISLILVFTGLVLFAVLCVFTAQIRHEQRQPILRARDGLPPVLSLQPDLHWHLFVSHVWSTGQDTAAGIKRSLCSMLPGLETFLGTRPPRAERTSAIRPQTSI